MQPDDDKRTETEEIEPDSLPDPDGSTFWHPDYFEPYADKAPYPEKRD